MFILVLDSQTLQIVQVFFLTDGNERI